MGAHQSRLNKKKMAEIVKKTSCKLFDKLFFEIFGSTILYGLYILAVSSKIAYPGYAKRFNI